LADIEPVSGGESSVYAEVVANPTLGYPIGGWVHQKII
jgi:hypothetical protein